MFLAGKRRGSGEGNDDNSKNFFFPNCTGRFRKQDTHSLWVDDSNPAGCLIPSWLVQGEAWQWGWLQGWMVEKVLHHPKPGWSRGLVFGFSCCFFSGSLVWVQVQLVDLHLPFSVHLGKAAWCYSLAFRQGKTEKNQEVCSLTTKES